MKIEHFVQSVTNKPSFLVKIWLFFFLLINKDEGKELVMDISQKVDRTMERADELNKKADLILEKTKTVTLSTMTTLDRKAK